METREYKDLEARKAWIKAKAYLEIFRMMNYEYPNTTEEESLNKPITDLIQKMSDSGY